MTEFLKFSCLHGIGWGDLKSLCFLVYFTFLWGKSNQAFVLEEVLLPRASPSYLEKHKALFSVRCLGESFRDVGQPPRRPDFPSTHSAQLHSWHCMLMIPAVMLGHG